MSGRRAPWIAAMVVGVGLIAAPVAFQMFSRAPEGGVMIDEFDAYGRCVLWNRACETYLGYTKDEVKGLFIRRFKKDVASTVAQSFAERHVRSHHVEASGAENTVFETLSNLTFQTIDRNRRSGGILFRTTLLKAFLSSPSACAATVEARLRRLEKMTGPEAECDREALTGLLKQIRQVNDFRKLEKLFQLLDEFGYGTRKAERVVIFSERIDTLNFLKTQITKRYGLKATEVGVFFGTLDDQKQQAMVKDFGTEKGKVRILLGSDAASEGINLHYFCHRLIHFDIPWSLITLEQRNGRIDRYGQQNQPDIRYLLTIPGDPELQGDLRILDRLVEKEDAAHKNLGDVAWLMRLHEAELEEKRVAEAVQNHESPEIVVPDEPIEDDFLAGFFEEEEALGQMPHAQTSEEFSLYANDLIYAREAFEELEMEVEWHDHLDGFSFEPPGDLKLRYEYLPPELRRSGHELKLTADRELVQKALSESRQDEDRWPEWELFWNQHPVSEWMNDKVLSRFHRHEAPVLKVTAVDQPTILFQGVVSNKRSQPVLVCWFGVQGDKVVEWHQVDPWLKTATTNPGEDFSEPELHQVLLSSIKVARNHVEKRRLDRGQELLKRMKPEEKRIQSWEKKKRASLKALDDGTPLNALKRKQLERERDEMEKRLAARRRWFDEGIRTSPNIYLRVAAALIP